MISSETIERIWKCKREILVGNKILSDMEELTKKAWPSETAEKLRDAFGRQQDLQLGIPCGDTSHRLLNVSPLLAVSVIKAHIANKEAQLGEAHEQAKSELNIIEK